MSYKVLARKYRPKNFTELVGQSVLVKTLSNAILYKKVHHAYILTGIRGVGKTTTARIIAKTVNCTNPSDISGVTVPCETCDSCTSITNNSHPDVIEFDAASNTGIDDVKNITELVGYNSVMGGYKVFIIDEVHMLSGKAFNSILKTLEEPPENVIFIFATTELHKVPITILSRCQKFSLLPVASDNMFKHLSGVIKSEDLNFEEKAVKLIAEKSGGSVRDALSLLDQLSIMNYNGAVTVSDVQSVVGFISEDDLKFLYDAILSVKCKDIISKIQDLTHSGITEAVILQGFMGFLYQKIHEVIASKQSCANLLRIWNVFINSSQDILYAFNKLHAIEMIFIKALYINSTPSVENILYSFTNKDIADVIKLFPTVLIKNETSL